MGPGPRNCVLDVLGAERGTALALEEAAERAECLEAQLQTRDRERALDEERAAEFEDGAALVLRQAAAKLAELAPTRGHLEAALPSLIAARLLCRFLENRRKFL